MNKLIGINSEKTKLEDQKSQIESKLKTVKAEYRDQLVDNAVESLMKIQEEDGSLSARDLKIYLSNLAMDLRDLYERG